MASMSACRSVLQVQHLLTLVWPRPRGNRYLMF